MNKEFRLARKSDLPSIVSVYNEAIRAGFQTADMNEISWADKLDWFQDHQTNNYALCVLELNHEVVGWLSLSPYRKGRGALSSNAEISYYLSNEFQSVGLGSYMMEKGILLAKEKGLKNLIAILLGANNASIRLLEKFNFKEWGRMPQIAEINEIRVDHLYFGLKL